MNSITRLFVILLPMVLMACSSFSNTNITHHRDQQYLSAKSIPPLRIPPGLATSAFSGTYPVSDRQYPESAKLVSDVPPGL